MAFNAALSKAVSKPSLGTWQKVFLELQKSLAQTEVKRYDAIVNELRRKAEGSSDSSLEGEIQFLVKAYDSSITGEIKKLKEQLSLLSTRVDAFSSGQDRVGVDVFNSALSSIHSDITDIYSQLKTLSFKTTSQKLQITRYFTRHSAQTVLLQHRQQQRLYTTVGGSLSYLSWYKDLEHPRTELGASYDSAYWTLIYTVKPAMSYEVDFQDENDTYSGSWEYPERVTAFDNLPDSNVDVVIKPYTQVASLKQILSFAGAAVQLISLGTASTADDTIALDFNALADTIGNFLGVSSADITLPRRVISSNIARGTSVIVVSGKGVYPLPAGSEHKKTIDGPSKNFNFPFGLGYLERWETNVYDLKQQEIEDGAQKLAVTGTTFWECEIPTADQTTGVAWPTDITFNATVDIWGPEEYISGQVAINPDGSGWEAISNVSTMTSLIA
jgi:hypothetical protein